MKNQPVVFTRSILGSGEVVTPTDNLQSLIADSTSSKKELCSDQQRKLWKRVGELARDNTTYYENELDYTGFAIDASKEFVLVPRSGIKALQIGDTLYHKDDLLEKWGEHGCWCTRNAGEIKSVVIASQWETTSSTGKEHYQGVHFKKLFQDGDFGSDGKRYYLTVEALEKAMEKLAEEIS